MFEKDLKMDWRKALKKIHEVFEKDSKRDSKCI